MFEDELIPLFEKCGTIWDLRLMMDPMTGTNRGYAFVTFTNRDAAQNAVKEVNVRNIISNLELIDALMLLTKFKHIFLCTQTANKYILSMCFRYF